MKKITVVIDMQNDFITGALANSAAESIIPSVLEEIILHVDNNCNFFHKLFFIFLQI